MRFLTISFQQYTHLFSTNEICIEKKLQKKKQIFFSPSLLTLRERETKSGKRELSYRNHFRSTHKKIAFLFKFQLNKFTIDIIKSCVNS